MHQGNEEPERSARLDKWLWTARFFKTRALAADAIDGGRVEVNGEKAKRAKGVRPGDAIRVRLGPYEHRLTITAVARLRGSASVAAGLYLEDPEGRAARERLIAQHRLAAQRGDLGTKGRPTKRDRRDIERWKKGEP
jgi:ribosome-associated heat shock protein Hsp15